MNGWSKNHTLKGGTSPYSLSTGEPPPPPPPPRDQTQHVRLGTPEWENKGRKIRRSFSLFIWNYQTKIKQRFREFNKLFSDAGRNNRTTRTVRFVDFWFKIKCRWFRCSNENIAGCRGQFFFRNEFVNSIFDDFLIGECKVFVYFNDLLKPNVKLLERFKWTVPNLKISVPSFFIIQSASKVTILTQNFFNSSKTIRTKNFSN